MQQIVIISMVVVFYGGRFAVTLKVLREVILNKTLVNLIIEKISWFMNKLSFCINKLESVF